MLDCRLFPIFPDALPERLSTREERVQAGGARRMADDATGHAFHSGA